VGNKNACPGVEQAFLGFTGGMEGPGVSEDSEPTAALGLCQYFIAQEEGLLRGRGGRGMGGGGKDLHWNTLGIVQDENVTAPVTAVEPWNNESYHKGRQTAARQRRIGYFMVTF
jgi:hypothetical protein